MNEKLILDRIKQNIIQGRRNRHDEGLDDELTGQPGVEELVKKALTMDLDPRKMLSGSIGQGMEEVGIRYEAGEYYIPDMLAAAEAVEAAMNLLTPLLEREKGNKKGKMVMATVEKDYHDIGKNIVSIMLKGTGLEIKDLGVDVTAEKIVETAEMEEAVIIGLSALLDTTMGNMQDTVNKLEQKNLRSQIKLIIGGAPTTPKFAKKIGADAHCKDAFEAMRTVNMLLR